MEIKTCMGKIAWTIHHIAGIIFGAVLLLGAISVAVTLYMRVPMADVSDAWSRYKADVSIQENTIDAMVESIGFGGMIHNFKNYVLRKDAPRLAKIKNSAISAQRYIKRLEGSNVSQNSIGALKEISGVIDAYVEALDVVEAGALKGLSAQEIDQLVKIDDSPALTGLSTVLKELRDQNSLSGMQSKTRLANDIRFAIGYGGMIHQFKNYVLRHDAPRVAKIETAFATAEGLISEYQSLEISEKEGQALSQIQSVIDEYRTNLKLAQDLVAQGRTAEEIDAAVNINDGPALVGLNDLRSEIARHGAGLSVSVYQKLVQLQKTLTWIAAAVFVSSVAIGLLVALILSRKIVKPIKGIPALILDLANADAQDENSGQTNSRNHIQEVNNVLIAVDDLRKRTAEIRRAEEQEKRQAEQKRAEERAEFEKQKNEEQALLEEEQRRMKQLVDDEKAQKAKQEHEENQIRLAEQAAVVGTIAEGLKRLASNDLSSTIAEELPGEYNILRSDFNSAVSQLSETINEIQVSTVNVREDVAQISAASNSLAKRTETQAASLEETAAALEELTTSVKSASENTQEVLTAFNEMKQDTEEGAQRSIDAVTSIAQISESSKAIGMIISVIDDIAFQTNLLALNAGVEAARAGKAGSGFAVVASEVRALAQRSSEAASEISRLINQSSEQVSFGVEAVEKVSKALDLIIGSVNSVTSQINEVSVATGEQANGIAEISNAVNELDKVTQQNAAMFEETNAASQNLLTQSEKLATAVGGFKMDATRDDGWGEQDEQRDVPMAS
ncbi:MAG: methyl-accepting chemotaxis protein [Paracoccaceae bacterium]